MFQVICIGSASKDVFFPTGDGVIVDTPEDVEAKQKVMFEVGAKYQIEDRYEAPGGVAANCAQGLARLGIDVACYARLGADQMGDWVFDEIQKEGVDTTLLERDSSAQTDLSAIIVLTQTGDRTIFYNRDANERLVVDTQKLSGAQWFFVSALNGAWEKNLDTILEIVRANGARLALNPGQHNLKNNPAKVAEAVALAEALLLNKDEAVALLHAARPDMDIAILNDETALIGALHELGAKIIALTDGLRGAWASDGGRIVHAPAGEKEGIVDTTGAGDAFGSGFLAAYIKGHDLETMLRWGTANGSSAVRFYGAQKGLLHEEDIVNRAVHVTII